MSNEEMINVINSVPKIRLSNVLGISRQMIYVKLKEKKDLEKLYESALLIKKAKEKKIVDSVQILKDKNFELKNTIIKYENKIIKLNDEITELKRQLLTYKKPYDEYINLLHRYRNQQSELFTYYKIYGRLGNDSKRNKESNIKKD